MLSIIEKMLALEQHEVFSGLTSEQLSQIAEQMKEVPFKKGEMLFQEGEPADSVYFIFKGRVRVKRGNLAISEISTGSAPVGGVAVFTESNRYFTAEAVEDCLTMRLLRDDLLTIMYDYPDIPINILKIMTRILIDLSISPAAGQQDPLLISLGLPILPEPRAKGK